MDSRNMADLVREPDERSGPAVLDREPILLPEQRKRAVRKLKNAVNGE